MITRRKVLAATGAALASAVPATAQSPQSRNIGMKINRNGSQPSRKGPEQNFTGSVRVENPFQSTPPARVGGAFVTFEPGARTAWHTHPLGQTLIVTAGLGWVQSDGAPREEIRPGDTVWIPAGEKHWHGATAAVGTTHIAFSEALDGKTVDWLEKVTDAQYAG